LRSVSQMNEMNYQLYRSRRKSISVEISRDARVIVRAPLRMSIRDIEAFLLSKREWIEKHAALVQQRINDSPAPLSAAERNALVKRAKEEIPARVKIFASRMGVEYGRIAIRTQRTRFGSCSSKRNLNFNLAIMLMPEQIRDYVIVHELAHLKEMNHSQSFWSEVEGIIPDYKEKRKWLQENGIMYINQLNA